MQKRQPYRYVCVFVLYIHAMMNSCTHVAVEMSIRSSDILVIPVVNIFSMYVMFCMKIYKSLGRQRNLIYLEGLSYAVYDTEFI